MVSLAFDLIGRDVSASKAFRDVGNEAERTGKMGEKAGSGIASGLKLAAASLLGAGLIEGFKSLYDAADESRKIGNLTTQVIKSTGGAANVSAKQVSDLAGAIAKKTGIDDEAIQSGQNLLLTFTNVRNEVGKGNDIFNQATATIEDMSTALGQDSSSSAIQLGKALNDPIKGVTALQRVGVSFTASQKEQIKTLVETGDTLGAQKLILAELNKEFGGAAEAAATPLGKLQQRLGDVAEALGGKFLPYVDKAATFLIDDLLPAAGGVADVVGGKLGPAFHVAGEALHLAYVSGKGVVDLFDSLPGPIQATIGVLGGVALLKGPLGSLFSTLKDVGETAYLRTMLLKDSIGALGGAGGVAKAGLGGLTGFFGGPWGIALAGATLGLTLLTSWLGKSDEATKRTQQATQDYADALRQANGVINDSVRAAAAKAAQDAGLLDVAKKVGIALPDVTSAITDQGSALNSTRSQLESFIESHTRLVTVQSGKGGAPIATEQLDSEGKAAQQALASLNQLSGQTTTTSTDQDQLAEATGKTSGSMGVAAGAAKQLQADLQDTATAASDARQQTDLFKTSLDVLTGQNVSLLQVQSQLQDALAAGKDAMDKEGGAVLDASGALDLHTQNGRKAADVLLDVRNSGNELISTMIQQGATAAEVSAKDADLRTSFIHTAMQMGISETAANELANQILGIPSERTTQINADTGPAAKSLAQIQQDIDDLYGRNIVVTVSSQGGLATYGTDQRNLLYSGGKKDGGPISGPGSGTSDTAGLFALSNGEHIWTAGEVSAAGGHSVMKEMRRQVLSAGRGRARGGPVDIHALVDTTPLDQAVSAAKQQLSAITASGGPAGAGVQRWLPLVLASLNLVGQPGSLAQTVLRRMQQESGGNPRAINLTDSNARRGTPSKGLMQVIDPTFRAYAMAGHAADIWDPLSNILASERYAMSRYGSLSAAYNKAGGYDNGGPLMPGYTLAYNGTGKPENVQTAAQAAASQQPMEVTVFAQFGDETMEATATRVVIGALTGATSRGDYNG